MPHRATVETRGLREDILNRSFASMLPPRNDGGIIGVMPARRTQGLSADLFTTAAGTRVLQPEPSDGTPQVVLDPVTPPSSARHVLPKDLPGALARLSDSELDKLVAAAIDEAKKRERLPLNLVGNSLEADQPSHNAPRERAPVRHGVSPKRQSNANDVPSSWTRGQLSAVRAAFKAGVKPSVIARQFRVSQSDVRKVLAAEARERKPSL